MDSSDAHYTVSLEAEERWTLYPVFYTLIVPLGNTLIMHSVSYDDEDLLVPKSMYHHLECKPCDL